MVRLRALARVLRDRAYLPEGAIGHDLVVLERRAEGAPIPTPIGHAGGAVTAAPSEEGALALARGLHERWPAPATRAGRLKRRLMRSELDRQDRRAGAVIEALGDLANRVATQERLLRVLPASLYEQAERIGLLRTDTEAALRRVEERLDALEGRDQP